MYYYFEAFRKYAVFSGRATRSEFWFFQLFSLLITFVLGFVGGAIAGTTGMTESQAAMPVDLYILAAMIPTLALAVRRLQDIGLNGLWLLICFVPFLGDMTLFVMFCLDSQLGPNRFGPNPKGVNPPLGIAQGEAI